MPDCESGTSDFLVRPAVRRTWKSVVHVHRCLGR